MTEPHFQDDDVTVYAGDCLDILRDLPDASVDAVVTDPPAGVSFMSKDWDHDRGGRTQWVAWMTEVMTECHRILKPGGHALVWGLPRTSHWTALAIEDAGFDIRDCITHLYGSGFPKSLDVSKAIDKAAGAERDTTRQFGPKVTGGFYSQADNRKCLVCDKWTSHCECDKAGSASADAERWQGWGTALKPASEHWWLARKPLGERTVAGNVLAHGTGALNVDGCRIGTAEDVPSVNATRRTDYPQSHKPGEGPGWGRSRAGLAGDRVQWEPTAGRWPANVVLSHTDGCRQVGVTSERVGGGEAGTSGFAAGYEKGDGFVGREVAAVWDCVEGCPVRELDRQSGTLHSQDPATRYRASDPSWSPSGTGRGTHKERKQMTGLDTGGASRFFKVAEADEPRFRYIPKANSSERPRVGAEGGDAVSGGLVAHPT